MKYVLLGIVLLLLAGCTSDINSVEDDIVLQTADLSDEDLYNKLVNITNDMRTIYQEIGDASTEEQYLDAQARYEARQAELVIVSQEYMERNNLESEDDLPPEFVNRSLE